LERPDVRLVEVVGCEADEARISHFYKWERFKDRLYKKEEDKMVDNLDIDTGFTDEELFEYLIDHDAYVDMPPKNVYIVNAVISFSNIRGDIIC